jgi:hypothetical protein
MARLHITEAELARDLHAVLEKARQGVEVVVEYDHGPAVVIGPPTWKMGSRNASKPIPIY